jgi:hypothetical protein
MNHSGRTIKEIRQFYENWHLRVYATMRNCYDSKGDMALVFKLLLRAEIYRFMFDPDKIEDLTEFTLIDANCAIDDVSCYMDKIDDFLLKKGEIV